ncbi:MAG: hypothetical protein H8E47_00350 [Anaerolineales bacterium]|nr:hypothetical protein [Anaerolineales bacterium]
MANVMSTTEKANLVIPEKPRIYVFKDRFSEGVAFDIAEESRVSVFRTLETILRIHRLVRARDISVRKPLEKRLVPFWHIKCHALYEYECSRSYELQVGDDTRTVTSVVVDDHRYYVINEPLPPHIRIEGVEHSVSEKRVEGFFDGISSCEQEDLRQYLERGFPVEKLDPKMDLEEQGLCVAEPKLKASSVISEAIRKAVPEKLRIDRLIREEVEVETLDLYFRPMYVATLEWKHGPETKIAEIDALVGEPRPRSSTFLEGLKQVLTPQLGIGISAVDIDNIITAPIAIGAIAVNITVVK